MGPRSPAGKEGGRICPVLPAGPTFPNAAAWRPLPEEQRDSLACACESRKPCLLSDQAAVLGLAHPESRGMAEPHRLLAQ